MKLEPHPFLKDFPMMPSHEIDALAADIKKFGQRVPIVIYGGKILDGRNRYEACKRLKIEPRTAQFTKANPKDYAVSVNFWRKHWTTGERAHFAALMSMESPEGRREATTSDDVVTEAKAAKMMSVSVPSVQRAKAKIRGKKPKPASKQSDNRQVVDAVGYPVPAASLAYWNRKAEAETVLSKMRAAKRAVKELLTDDPMWSEVNLNGVLADLGSAINRFSSAVPTHVCLYCGGVKPDSCKACKGRGVISDFAWRMVPEELRKMREIKRTFSGRITS